MAAYTPECLLDYDDSKQERHYAVKWQGDSDHFTSWEPASHLDLTEELLSKSAPYLQRAAQVEQSPESTKTSLVLDVDLDENGGLKWVVQVADQTQTCSTKEAVAQHPDALLDYLLPKIQIHGYLK